MNKHTYNVGISIIVSIILTLVFVAIIKDYLIFPGNIGYFLGSNNWLVLSAGLVFSLCILAAIGSLYFREFKPPEGRQNYFDFRPISKNTKYFRLIFLLRKRSQRLRFVAGITQALILMSLSAGLYLFINAEQFASKIDLDKELEITHEINNLKSNAPEFERKINFFTNMKNGLEDKKSVLESSKALITTESNARNIESKIKGIEKDIINADSSIRNIKSEVDAMNRTVSIYEKALSEPSRELSNDSDSKNQPPSNTVFLVSLLSTKIGSAITLLFLVQLLVYLYRYTVRLASFYDSRADILSIMKPDENLTLKKLNELLISENIGFGKQPTTPAKNIIDLIKALPEKRATNTARPSDA